MEEYETGKFRIKNFENITAKCGYSPPFFALKKTTPRVDEKES